MKKIIASGCLFAALPLVSAAHPGHGTTDGFTITHYFTEPVHVVVSLSIIIAAAVYIRYQSSKQKETN